MKRTLVFTFFSFLLLIYMFSCAESQRKRNKFPNNIKGTSWIIKEGGLIHIDGEKSYHLSKKIDTALLFNFYAIDFIDDDRFKSYDSWECGNDCFTAIVGRYYFTGIDQIEMEVDRITHSGTCEVPVQVFKPSKVMSFEMVKTGDQLQLIRK